MAQYAAKLVDRAPLLSYEVVIIKQAKLVQFDPLLAKETNVIKLGKLVGSGGATIIEQQVVRYVLNRGRNTGAGDAFVYWTSPLHADSSGIYYPVTGKPPFGQLTDIIGVTTVKTAQ